MTTSELCARLPDVSKATVYRHVALLVDGGILELDGEHRVRGAVERRYRLCRDRPPDDTPPVGSAGPDDLRRAFGVAMTALIAEFDAYLAGPPVDPDADLVDFRQHALWLSPVERAELVSALRAVIAPRLRNAAAPGRVRHLLSPILFPTDEPARGPGERTELAEPPAP